MKPKMTIFQHKEKLKNIEKQFSSNFYIIYCDILNFHWNVALSQAKI